MDWLAVGIIVAFFVAFLLWQLSQQFFSPAAEWPLLSTSAKNAVPNLILSTFRRELANYMVRTDPNRFLSFYRKACETEAAINVAGKAERAAHFTLICKKYPTYEDFDLVGTREHVLYAETLARYSVEDIEERYLDLVKFHALARSLDADWRSKTFPATSDSDRRHLESYVESIKDTRFRQHFVGAAREFFGYWYNSHYSQVEGSSLYETEALSVYHVPSLGDSRYGFHFKDSDEFGLYLSLHDDARDKTYEEFFRSDSKFEILTNLRELPINDLI